MSIRRCTVRSVTGGGMTVKSNDQIAPAGDAAVTEIVAAVASLGGSEGLMDLAADLATALAMLIEQVAAAQGRSAVDVADELFHD
jgi:hypothetical protein